jgi:hypothetical protein
LHVHDLRRKNAEGGAGSTFSAAKIRAAPGSSQRWGGV